MSENYDSALTYTSYLAVDDLLKLLNDLNESKKLVDAFNNTNINNDNLNLLSIIYFIIFMSVRCSYDIQK